MNTKVTNEISEQGAQFYRRGHPSKKLGYSIEVSQRVTFKRKRRLHARSEEMGSGQAGDMHNML